MVSAVEKFSELVLDGFTEGLELVDHFLFWELWILILHSLEIVNDALLEGVFNNSHGQLSLLLLGLGENSLACLIVGTDVLHHSNGLVEWAVVIEIREGVLLQELFLDQGSDSKSGLLILTEGIFSDKLHNFDKIVLFLQDLLEGSLVSHEVWISLVVVFRQDSIVVCERDIPIDGWEMLSLSELLIQTPEHLHDS